MVLSISLTLASLHTIAAQRTPAIDNKMQEGKMKDATSKKIKKEKTDSKEKQGPLAVHIGLVDKPEQSTLGSPAKKKRQKKKNAEIVEDRNEEHADVKGRLKEEESSETVPHGWKRKLSDAMVRIPHSNPGRKQKN
jgi:hypothetical protein